MNDDTPRHRAPREPDRARWVARYRASGMALHRFAQQHGLKPTQLHYWVYQPRRVSRSSAPTFQEVKLDGLFASAPWAVELALAGGPTVRVRSNADPPWVADLVRHLRRVC